MPADFTVPFRPTHTYRLLDNGDVRRVDRSALGFSHAPDVACCIRGCGHRADEGLVCAVHKAVFAAFTAECARCGTPTPIACDSCAVCAWSECAMCGAYHATRDLCDGAAVAARTLVGAYHGNASSVAHGVAAGRHPLRSPHDAYSVGERCYGLEIEVACPWEKQAAATASLWSTLGPAILLAIEADGSIGDAGFEIITQPLSPAEHALALPALCDAAVRFGCTAHKAGTGYGLHVHVSREDARWPGLGVSEADAQTLRRIFRDSPHMFGALARRQPTMYANFGAPMHDHYAAISTRPAQTVEFRSARASLKASTLTGWIDFIDRGISIVKAQPTIATLRDLLLAMPEDCPARIYANERGVNLST